LSYFNELVGGPREGWRWLVDSNLDWGQDMKRLARYLAARGEPPVKLAYFGLGDPSRYGIRCEMVISSVAVGEPAELTGGTYVVSATQLVGAMFPEARDAYWREPGNLERYAALARAVSQPPAPDEPAATRAQRAYAAQVLDVLQRGRLINRLAHRSPDDRVGYSLFVYR